jgi:hypothetical protein
VHGLRLVGRLAKRYGRSLLEPLSTGE